MNDLRPIAARLGQIVRLLASNQKGDVIAAAGAIVRRLEGAGLSIHDLGDFLEAKKRFSEAEALEIFRKGIEKGRREAHAELPATFKNVNDEPSWHEIACECQAHPEILRPNERDFVGDMVRRTVHDGEPTEQGNWLRAIYARIRK